MMGSTTTFFIFFLTSGRGSTPNFESIPLRRLVNNIYAIASVFYAFVLLRFFFTFAMQTSKSTPHCEQDRRRSNSSSI